MPLPLIPIDPHARIGLWEPANPLLEAVADASIGLFEVDLQTQEASWSPALFRLFGFDPQTGATVGAAGARVHPEDVPARTAAWQAVSATDTDAPYAAEYRVLHPDGGVRWLSARGRVVHAVDPEGRTAVSLVGIVRDDSGRHLAQAELAATEQRRDRFLALLAHDLRNPLAPLHTAAELMRRAEMQPTRVIAISEMLSRQVAQLAGLIDDLVDVSRANQGRIELHRQPVELRDIVEQAVASVDAFVGRRRQAVETRFDAGPTTVQADPERLVQVVSRLLEHASRASTEDATIRVEAGRRHGETVLSVSDDGAGIERDQLAEVFDLYPSADGDPMRRQTLGTGMALVKALVGLHGGSVRAASDGAGQGATYTVVLPDA